MSNCHNGKNYKKEQYYDGFLPRWQYWDTVRLKNNGLIRVIKSKKVVYPNGY